MIMIASFQDFHVAKLSDFMHSRANITALRLVDMKHHIADDLLRGQDSPQKVTSIIIISPTMIVYPCLY